MLSIRSKLERGGEKDSYICSPSGLSGKFEFYETKGMGHVFLSKHGSDNALNELASWSTSSGAVDVDFLVRHGVSDLEPKIHTGINLRFRF